MKTVMYDETQKYPVSDLVLAITVFGLIITLVVSRLTAVSGFSVWQDLFAVAVLLIISGAIYYMWRLRMTLSINKKNLKLSYAPVDIEHLKVKWKNVKDIEMVNLPRFYRWRGWNVHFSSGNKWYNLNGKGLLKITLDSGEVILVGCTQPRSIEDVLRNNDRTRHLLKA